MFVDGIRDTGGYSRDTFNLEQVEVAKGPSSAVSGRGSTGGSVNLVSKTPQMRASYGGTIDAGTAAFERSTADINQPLGNGSAALRVNAMWTDGGVPRRDVVENQSWAVAPSLGLGLMSRTRVTLSYLHLDQHNMPDYGLPWVPATNVPLSEYAGGQPVENNNFYGLRPGLRAHRQHRDRDNHDLSNAFAETSPGMGGATRSLLRRVSRATPTDIRRTDVKFRVEGRSWRTRRTLSGTSGGWHSRGIDGIGSVQDRSTMGARLGPNPTSPDTGASISQPYTAQMLRTVKLDAVAVSTAASLARKLAEEGADWRPRWSDRRRLPLVAVTRRSEPLSRVDQPGWRAGNVCKPKPNGSPTGLRDGVQPVGGRTGVDDQHGQSWRDHGKLRREPVGT